MKREQSYLILITLIISFLAACTALNKGQDNLVADQNKMTEEMDALVLTAVFETVVYETSVSEHLTQSAPTSTSTPPPTGTNTPVPPDTSDTPSPEPTWEDPWLFQSYCTTNEKCVKYTIDNRTRYWLHATLTKEDSGASKAFSIRPRTRSEITLDPGQYKAVYTGYCWGEADTITKYWRLDSFIDRFGCIKTTEFVYFGRTGN